MRKEECPFYLASTCVDLNSTYCVNGVLINMGYLHMQVGDVEDWFHDCGKGRSLAVKIIFFEKNK